MTKETKMPARTPVQTLRLDEVDAVAGGCGGNGGCIPGRDLGRRPDQV